MSGELLKSNKLLIIGGSGNLGKALKKNSFFKKSYFPTKKKLNLLNKFQIDKFLTKNKINIIINTAALTEWKIVKKTNL